MTGAAASAVEQVLGHRFRNPALRAGVLPPSPSRPDDTEFQRLEFLGDRVLGLMVAGQLFAAYPDAPEGALAIRLSHLVSGETLAVIARDSGLADAVAADMRPDPFPDHERALGECVEAALGALWSDGAAEAAREFVARNLAGRIAALTRPPKDAKTALQEWALARGLGYPVYTVLERAGADHGPEFTIEVSVEAGPCSPAAAQASGRTKRQAEKGAAGKLLRRLTAGR